MTPDEPFPRAWEGGGAAPQHGLQCKEGVQLPKGIPRDPQPQGSKGLPWSRLELEPWATLQGDAQKSFEGQQ